jgi:hypothetical protein
LTAVEQRVLELMRAELTRRAVPARAVPVAPRVDAVPVNELLTASEQRQLDRLSTIYSDLVTQITTVRKDVGGLRDYVAQQVNSGGGR